MWDGPGGSSVGGVALSAAGWRTLESRRQVAVASDAHHDGICPNTVVAPTVARGGQVVPRNSAVRVRHELVAETGR